MSAKVKANELKILWMVIIIHTLILYYICDFDKAMETYKDELIYFNLAKCLADGRNFTLHGMELNFTHIAYSLLISPVFWIKDVVLSVHLIILINSFLMSISILPVWMSCKELQVNIKIRWAIISIILIFPSMTMAATFMTENLYWPLTLIAYYFILRTIKYKKILDAFVAGSLSFLCYFCKEVGVCIFLSVTVWFFISPFDSYWFEAKNCEENRGHIVKFLISHFEWKIFFVYVSVYEAIYVIVNNFFLAEVVNGYGGVVGSVSSLAGRINLSMVLYIIYAVILYIVYVMIAFFIIPVIYPMMNLKEMNPVARKMYFYALILLMGTILTIVCTISIGADYGRTIPRVHMRYFSSIIGLILPICGSVISNEKNFQHKKLWVALGVFWILSAFIFKGAYIGSSVDSPELGYAVYLHRKYGVMNIGEISVYIAGILCNIFSAIILIIGYFVSKMKTKYVYYFFCVAAVLICIFNTQKALEVIKDTYSVPKGYISDMEQINDYFIDNSLEDNNVLFVSKYWYSKNAKVYDTYFIGKHTYEAGYGILLNMLENISSNSISDCVFTNPIQGETFVLDQIDYFISDIKGLQDVVGNLEYLENISSENYWVYKNMRPTEICYLDPQEVIDFTGKGYSTLSSYGVEGISVPEGTFSWTDGNELSVSCDFPSEMNQVKIRINVNGTFNGVQNFIIYQNDLEVSRGSISESGQIMADLSVKEGKCDFKIALPDAVSPYTLGISDDTRILALRIASMEFITEQ